MVEVMEIQKGFQKTEVGIIPSDWMPSTVGDLIRFEGGSQPPLSTFSNIQHKDFIRLLQIRDYKTDKYLTFIPEKLARKKCTVDDIMIGRYGPPIFQILTGLDGAYNVALIKAIPCKDLNPEYTLQFLKQKALLYFIEKLSQRSGGQTGIDIQELKRYSFPLPPTKAEQTAIATALNDADTLITQLEKLIAKKRNIKQGAMQGLLTGRKRLPGFEKKKGCGQTEVGVIPGDWEVKKLIKIAEICTGSTPPTSDQNNYGHDYFFVTPADLGKEKIIRSTEKKLSLKGFNISRKYPKSSILFTCIGSTIGKGGVTDRELTSNQQINAVLPNSSFNSDYLYYTLNLFSNKIKKNASETAVPIINKTEFGETPIPLPSTKSEQTAIAQILSDMDAEIEGLEKKLEKTRKIKQGMMQNLLTGRVRLV